MNFNLADNEGSDSASGTKMGGSTYKPCRICEIRREHMMRSNIDDVPKRNSNAYKRKLESSFDIYCKSVKVQRKTKDLSEEEHRVLKFCKHKSLQPIFPALNELAPSYPGHSTYSRYPPDYLHTFIGLLEYWVSITVTIVAKVERLKWPGFTHLIAQLESFLETFPTKQSMPMTVKHFNKGLESYCPGFEHKTGTEITTGYGSLGMIDNKDVPSLVLQLILGTIYIKNL